MHLEINNYLIFFIVFNYSFKNLKLILMDAVYKTALTINVTIQAILVYFGS